MLSKKKFSRLLIRSFLFVIILLFLDQLTGGILRYLYFKQDSGFLYRTTYAMDSTRADILIFGSSTANHHYFPPSFEKRMNMTTYNTGRDGNTIFYNYAVLKSVLERYVPKIIILDFNLGEFQKEPGSYDRLSALLPYCKEHPFMKSLVELRGPYEKYKMISKTYPFNSFIFSILVGNTEYNKSRDYMDDIQGFVPLTNVWNKKIAIDTTEKKYTLDQKKIKLFKSFIKDCVNSKVQLYIVISPGFLKYTKRDPSAEIASRIANEYSVPFYDFSKDTLYWNNPDFFYNENHLNMTGAKFFSNQIIDTIMSRKKQRDKNEISVYSNKPNE